MKAIAIVLILAGVACGQLPIPKDVPTQNSFKSGQPAMNEIYRDETHCLTLAEIRSNQDSPISCFCRDSIVDARYVYFTYLFSGKDADLGGTLLTLQQHAAEMCSESNDVVYAATKSKEWTWGGPEVVRTYPSDEVIQRISPELKDGKPFGRWVPFTIQLIYHDAKGRVVRTENYASKELFPVLPK